MANETPPVAQATPNSPENPLALDPSRDTELNDSLNTFFTKNGTPNETENIEQPKQEAKNEIKVEDPDKGQADIKSQRKAGDKREDKPVVDEKPLLTPDEIDKTEPKNQSAWTALKNNNKRSHRIIEQKDSEIAKLKSVVAERGQMSQKEVEALKAENGELAKYRAMLDVQADPEFNTTYDTPMIEKIDSMKELLKGWNISDEIINGIDFLDKNRVGSIAKVLRQNEQHIASEFELEEFMSNAKEVLDLSKKREAALKKHGETYKETLEAKKKQSFEKDAESEGRAFKHLETVAQAKDKAGNSMFPFLNKMEIKETATQPEIDQINSHNKMVELMNQKVQQAFKMNLPEERMEVAVAAAAAHYMSAQLKAAQGKIQSLESEIKKISAVNTETEKPKAPAHRNGNGKIMDTDEALTAHFGRS